MSKRPSFQFYPGDWLASKEIYCMTPAEEGAYIRLLCYCWKDEDCSLENQDEFLAYLSRLGEGWFKGGSTKILKCFEPHPNKPGFLTHPRLMKEREKQNLWRKKSQEGGKKSAEARNTKGSKKLKGGSTTLGRENTTFSQPKGNSSSSSSSKVIDIKNISITSQKNLGGLFLPNFLTEEIFQNFLTHRKSLKKPMTEHAQKLLIKKLTKFHEQGHDVTEMINESILRGWLSVFQPNQQPTKGNGNGKENGNSNSTNRNKTKSEQSWQWYEQQLKESVNTENIFCNENDVPIKI